MKKSIFLASTLIILCAFFTSCDKKENKNNAATGQTVEIDVATSWNKWNYFSFSQGKVIGTGDADLESDSIWKLRNDWDIAFTRLYARTNSGASGNGNGGIMEIGVGNDNKTVVFADLTEAPSTGYQNDVISQDNDGQGLMVAMPPQYYNGATSNVVNPWLQMAGMTITVSPKVFALKTGDGKYAKIYLKGYETDEGKKNTVIMEYVYQSDGSTNLSTSN